MEIKYIAVHLGCVCHTVVQRGSLHTLREKGLSLGV